MVQTLVIRVDLVKVLHRRCAGLLKAAGAALLLGASFVPAAQAQNVGVSVQIGQPGFYGRIDIGNTPRPTVINAQPIVVQPAPQVVAQPVYLRVPPGHQKHWAKHCASYNACGQPVYFVQEQWYTNAYGQPQQPTPQHAEGQGREHGHGHGHGHHGEGKGHGKGRGKD